MPNYFFIGGLGTEEAKPLPNDIDSFVQEAEFGVIVLSFGSAISEIPDEAINRLLTAFRGIKQRVVMRYNGKSVESPPNVLILKWLPQNDLLGYSKTRLFITHGGNNGQLESLYHGVPMVVLPFGGVQNYNAHRVVAKGFGKALNMPTFQPEDLVAAINEVIDNPTYKETIQRASEIYKSLPNPQKRLVYWTEHFIKYDASHLRSYSLEMPAYQFFMLDIVLFVLLVILILVLILYLTFRAIFRR